ncbi:hypothetical protein PG997_000608 [Apiospora hydei]|uniref:Uncharacterized protein n=1 Tax=Apiospora hydei TaxID=1337664 RepID=A0ABR1XB83_9PEZI
MAPSKWNAEKNEALLTSLGKAMLSTATGVQRTLIEDHMEQAGYEGTTWEAIRYVEIFLVFHFVCMYTRET